MKMASFSFKDQRFWDDPNIDDDPNRRPSRSLDFMKDRNWEKLKSCYFESFEALDEDAVQAFTLLNELVNKIDYKLNISKVLIYSNGKRLIWFTRRSFSKT